MAQEWLYVGGNLANLGPGAWAKWFRGEKMAWINHRVPMEPHGATDQPSPSHHHKVKKGGIVSIPRKMGGKNMALFYHVLST